MLPEYNCKKSIECGYILKFKLVGFLVIVTYNHLLYLHRQKENQSSNEHVMVS